MKILLRTLWTWTLLMAAAVQAAPVSQSWVNANPDVPQGLFDAVALRFVSQSGGQTGFSDVIIAPTNGWTSAGFDPLLTYATGAAGQDLQFWLVFDGLASDQVQWEIWYYLDHQLLGGARYVGNLGRTSFSFEVLDATANPPAALPEPAALLLGGIALFACALASRRRHR